MIKTQVSKFINNYLVPEFGKKVFKVPEPELWYGFGDGSSGSVIVSENTTYSQPIQATTFTLNENVTLSTTRLKPIIIKATENIIINGIISADGKGYTYEEDHNYFKLEYSTQNVKGSIGISGGGSSGNAGRASIGGQPVPVSTFLPFIKSNYKYLLEQGLFLFPVFGGGGGNTDLTQSDNFSTGGGCIVLSAPNITINGSLFARGLPGNGGNWNGKGGGGGGLILLVCETLNSTNATLDACGGGGGGASSNGIGTDGVWQNGGISPGAGYTRGGAGGGSTALNSDGGTPGIGGNGTQYKGDNGTTTGVGGAGGNETGSDRGGRGGSGGGAGKIAWVKVSQDGVVE